MELGRRSLLAGLAASGLGFCGLGFSGLGGIARAQGRSVRVPFSRDSGMVTIDVVVAGHTVAAAIDNGAAISLIDRRFADRLGLSRDNSLRLNGGRADQAEPLSLAIADRRLTVAPVITDLTMVNGVLSRPIAMVLGYELFASAVVQFEFDRSRMTLHPPGARGGWFRQPLPLTALPGRKFAAPLRIGPSTVLPAMIDLGAASAVTISRPLAERLGVSRIAPQSTAAASVFIGDKPRLFVSRLVTGPPMSFANVDLRGAPVEILAPDEPVFSRYGVTLGAPVLSRYELWFDLPGRRLWARPNDNAGLPFERDRVGVQGYMDGASFRIMHVRVASPAEGAGLTTADRIDAIDDRPAAELIPELKYAAPVGKSYRLALADGRSLTLTARDYY